uniref:DNA repair metallo-beta-lactamase domain-containing protein n=1 Tax=Romanomermis culicivorax TaxID=13658 RepID=A0A915JQP5_ROMCU
NQNFHFNSKLYTNVGHYLRVKYSSYSSLDEIRQLLSFLKPQNTYPNVIAANQSLEKIYELISDLLPDQNFRDDQVRKIAHQQCSSSSWTTNFPKFSLNFKNQYYLPSHNIKYESTDFLCGYSYYDGKPPGLESDSSFLDHEEEEETYSKIDYSSDQDMFQLSR